MKISQSDQQRLNAFYDHVKEHSQVMLGYPAATDFDYEALKPFMDYLINNVGDPFVEGTYKLQSFEFEREVIDFWARLTHAPEDNYWGYVTNGGTEGNLYGLYLAREILPKGIVYFSQDTHYSVTKNLHFLNMRNIMIRSQANGEIDYEDLRETLKINRAEPAIVFANIGTTMTEAKDNVAKIREIFDELVLSQYYIHSDAAMTGSMLPFLETKPKFDFADGADSISISGHKFIGAPIPCGIVLARKDYVQRISRSIAYIGNLDTTITGSRNGLTPLMMWYAIRSFGEDGFRKRAQRSVALAEYAEAQLKKIGVAAWRNPNSLTVVMPEAASWIQKKWQLATAKGVSHIMLMPSNNIDETMIDNFVRDMASEASS